MPVPTLTPRLTPKPKPFDILYPENNTKVTNPNVTFVWSKLETAKSYRFLLYEGTERKGPRSIRISWKKVFGGNTRLCRYTRRLNQGKPYVCFVIPLYLVAPFRTKLLDIAPKTVTVNLATEVASDPIPDKVRNKTFAELTTEEKNSISHRGIAWRKMIKFLKEN